MCVLPHNHWKLAIAWPARKRTEYSGRVSEKEVKWKFMCKQRAWNEWTARAKSELDSAQFTTTSWLLRKNEEASEKKENDGEIT